MGLFDNYVTLGEGGVIRDALRSVVKITIKIPTKTWGINLKISIRPSVKIIETTTPPPPMLIHQTEHGGSLDLNNAIYYILWSRLI